MRGIAASILLIALASHAAAQSPASSALRGTIVDARTSAPVAGARVVVVQLSRSTVSDADGHFVVDGVPPGTYTVTVSLIGYVFVRRDLEIGAQPLDLTIPLTPGSGGYQETVSVSPPPTAQEVGVGADTELGSAALQDLRGVAADDPMRAVQALPGVATGDDFQSEFSVRGSEFRHVGVVLDSTATQFLLHTVRSNHDTGSIAMINTDVLDRASLMAGPHPQRHGDWLGATLDFGLREGSRDRATSRAAASATTASFVAEGPLGHHARGSWLISGRWSYIDWLVRKLYPSIDGTLGFTDMQSKFAYDLTSRQQLQFVLIAGDAAFRNDNTSLANGIHTADSKNSLASVAWRYTRDRWLVTQRASFVGSRFEDLGRVDQELGRGTVKSLLWRGDASWFLTNAWSVEFGGKTESQHQSVTQRNFTLVAGVPQQRFISSSSLDANLTSAWGQVSRRTPAGGVSVGVRTTRDNGVDTPLIAKERRVVASPWLLGETRVGPLTLRASAGISHQWPELEFQRAIPERLPERAELVDVGVEGRLPAGLRWQVTPFARREENVLRPAGEDHLDSNNKRVTESIFPEFASTLNGRSRGVDLLLARRAPSGLTGWIGYTYAHTSYHDRLTGESFDGDFDQRHTLNVFVQERVSYRTSVSAKLRVGSNFPLVGYFQGNVDALRLGTERNQVRLPTYARLDLRATRTYTFDRRRLTLFIEIVNATNHRNLGQAPGSISGTSFTANNYTRKLLPFLPSAGVLMEF